MKSCILTFTLAASMALPFYANAQAEWQSITPAEAALIRQSCVASCRIVTRAFAGSLFQAGMYCEAKSPPA